MIVEFFSAEISTIVWSWRSWRAPGEAADDVGRLAQLLRRLQLALGGDDLGPPFPLGLGLAGHGPLHLLGQADVADLDPVHLDAPRLGLGVEGDLELGVDPLPLGEQLVELVAADDRPQRGLGDELAGGVPVADLAPPRPPGRRPGSRPRRRR